MSRSHISNMYSISSLPSINQELSTPRSAPSPAYNNGACTPPPLQLRESSERPRDSGVQAIGAFFSTPYDSDLESDSEEIIPTPKSYTHTPIARTRSTRAISVNSNVKTTKGLKDALEAKIKSQTGELYHWDNIQGENQHHYATDEKDDDEEEEDKMENLELPKSPARRELISRQSDESGRVRPLTVVEFPEPTLQPNQGHGKGYPQPLNNLRPNTPIRSPSDDQSAYSSEYSNIPFRLNTSPLNSNRPQPRINTTSLTPPRVILLPPSTSPISPMLAAPPQSHFSPLSSPSSPFTSSYKENGHGKTDSINGSIRGYDIMVEKKALFREGQEELMSPFSTRREKPGRSGLNRKSQTKSTFLASGMDFWKRFNVHVKLDEAEKAQHTAGSKCTNESAWLSKAQERRGRIKKIIWVVLLIIIILAGGLTAYFLTRPSSPPKSIATSI
ncbi:uncharacterized protein I206_101749 [Kwoniella pini CBS 10737]|uniref:Uncharacterized protein n=1 Tax=Kwoniella pini CBS 10737 TaxID=1296096 RepID=A0A1B9HVT6_9TREE|nr:uncharacterized protein I206_06281 [Kwoniella pini CBS 10737]OCF47385.1 hypothetical protein I206_06281 [Kwoniella pini CBS 10737]